jgi:hypothetical protein
MMVVPSVTPLDHSTYRPPPMSLCVECKWPSEFLTVFTFAIAHTFLRRAIILPLVATLGIVEISSICFTSTT